MVIPSNMSFLSTGLVGRVGYSAPFPRPNDGAAYLVERVHRTYGCGIGAVERRDQRPTNVGPIATLRRIGGVSTDDRGMNRVRGNQHHGQMFGYPWLIGTGPAPRLATPVPKPSITSRSAPGGAPARRTWLPQVADMTKRTTKDGRSVTARHYSIAPRRGFDSRNGVRLSGPRSWVGHAPSERHDSERHDSERSRVSRGSR
jgi:hypothetical protein